MYIETKRLIVRDFENSDADALYKIKYDEQVMEYNPTFVKRNASFDDIQESISYFISMKDLGDFSREIYYPIVLKEVNSIIGVITVSVLDYLYETQMG